MSTDRPANSGQGDQLVHDILGELNESRQDFQDLMARRWPRILENKAGKVDIIVHLHLRREIRRRAESSEFCAVLRSLDTIEDGAFGIAARRIPITLLETVEPNTGKIQEPMLVTIPEVVEYIKRIGSKVRPEWLQSLDDCNSGVGQSVNHRSPLFLVFIALPEDRKTRYPTFRRSSIYCSQSGDKMIQEDRA
jgi:hypothetical protein